MRNLVAAIAAALPLLAAAQDSQPPPPATPPPPQYAPLQPAPTPPPARAAKQRDSWYFGLGLGTGGGSVELFGGSANLADLTHDGAARIAFNLRLGGTVSPRLLVGFDGGFVGAMDGDSTARLNYYDLGLMYFPMERGPYLRGAVGLSTGVWKRGSFEGSSSGFNVLGGVGYALWLGRTFNLTFNVDGARYWLSDGVFGDSTAWSAWLGFDWY
jgi:hypothetical protein